jgi:hypothetical protein
LVGISKRTCGGSVVLSRTSMRNSVIARRETLLVAAAEDIEKNDFLLQAADFAFEPMQGVRRHCSRVRAV